MSTMQRATTSNAWTWANDFFSCCSPGGLCILTTCCPCITYGRTQHRVKYGSLDDYSCCNSSCIVFALAAHFGLGCIPAMMQRKLMRKKFNLEGSWLGDFCRSCSCTCCVLMQNEKESEQRVSARVAEPYQPHDAMVYRQ